MKNTETPAFRLMISSIQRSLTASGKKHLIITGDRGSGKTTLLKALFPEVTPGITTWAEPMKAVYLKDNTSEKTIRIGYFDETVTTKENRMKPLAESFSDSARDIVLPLKKATNQWITIDEIGYLESISPEYQSAILELMDAKKVAMVVRKQSTDFITSLLNREDTFVVDLDNPLGSSGIVIMASGLGKRFGSNKLIYDLNGKPMIRWILDATDGLFKERIVVTRHNEVAKLCDASGIKYILHDLPYRSDTVRLGLEAIGDTVDTCAFMPGDQPLISGETLEALLLASADTPQNIWRTSFEETVGSPVIFPSSLFEELKALPDGKGGNVVIKKHPEVLRLLPVNNAYELMDIDTPEDIKKVTGG